MRSQCKQYNATGEYVTCTPVLNLAVLELRSAIIGGSSTKSTSNGGRPMQTHIKINNFECEVITEHDVLRLDIEMEYLVGVKEFDSSNELMKVCPHQFFIRKGLVKFICKEIVERTIGCIWHYKSRGLEFGATGPMTYLVVLESDRIDDVGVVVFDHLLLVLIEGGRA